MTDTISALEAKAASLVEAGGRASQAVQTAQQKLADLTAQLDTALVAGDIEASARLHGEIRQAQQDVADREQIVAGIHQRQVETNSELHRARSKERLAELEAEIDRRQRDLALASDEAWAATLALGELISSGVNSDREVVRLHGEANSLRAQLAGETRVPPNTAAHLFQRAMNAHPQLGEVARALKII